MSLLSAERKLKDLWDRYHQPDKETWEKEWQIALEEAKATKRTWLQTKMWHEHEVDFELRDEWLEKLNLFADILEARVGSVCAGHPHGVSGLGGIQGRSSGPSFALSFRNYETASHLAPLLAIPRTDVTLTIRRPVKYTYYRLFVEADFKHTGKNQDQLAAWWGEILRNLEAAVLTQACRRVRNPA